MKQQPNKIHRKKFLVVGAAGAAAISFFGLFKIFPVKKKEVADRVKMLTQDGKLVEIDSNLIASGGRKVTVKEMQNWINK